MWKILDIDMITCVNRAHHENKINSVAMSVFTAPKKNTKFLLMFCSVQHELFCHRQRNTHYIPYCMI